MKNIYETIISSLIFIGLVFEGFILIGIFYFGNPIEDYETLIFLCLFMMLLIIIADIVHKKLLKKWENLHSAIILKRAIIKSEVLFRFYAFGEHNTVHNSIKCIRKKRFAVCKFYGRIFPALYVREIASGLFLVVKIIYDKDSKDQLMSKLIFEQIKKES